MAGEITIQLPADISPDQLRAIMEAAGPATVVESADLEPEAAIGWFAAAFDRAMADFQNLPQAIETGAAAIRAQSGQSVIGVLFAALAIAAAAYLVELLIRRVTPGRGQAAGPAFSQRLGAGLCWLAARALSLAAFVVIALILARIFISASAGRQIFIGELTVVLVQRVSYAIVALIYAPFDGARRLAGMEDAAARKIGLAFIALFFFNGALRIGLALIALLTGDGPEDDLLSIFVYAAWWLSFTIAFFHVRREIASLIRGVWGHLRIFGRSVSDLAGYWPVVAAALALASAVAGSALVLGLERSGAFAGSFIIFALTPFVIAGITTLKREKVEAAAPARRPALEGWFSLAEGGAFVLSA
ncbi:MAG: hypothetical protein ACK5MQ_18085, partial [Pikeienuella sp.]